MEDNFGFDAELDGLMANREDLAIIRAARAGKAEAQLALGRRYLFGGNGLPQSYATALHWLERAARQDMADAWLLIGEHISYEVVAQQSKPLDFAVCMNGLSMPA